MFSVCVIKCAFCDYVCLYVCVCSVPVCVLYVCIQNTKYQSASPTQGSKKVLSWLVLLCTLALHPLIHTTYVCMYVCSCVCSYHENASYDCVCVCACLLSGLEPPTTTCDGTVL